MTKFAIAFSFLLVTGAVVQAQDLKKAKNAYTLAMLKPEALEDAKVEVDKLMTDAKMSKLAESYMLKMQVYSKIAANEALLAKYPTSDIDAYTALKKYLELEPNEEKLKADRFDGINNVYNAFFQQGVKLYKAEQWEKAFDKFKNMAAMGDLLISRKWSTSPFDTTSYLYAAATAQNAKLEPEAVQYYSKLADI